MKNKIIEYDIDKILNHINQPRTIYTQESIVDLANSIEKFGLLQPIVLSSRNLPYRLIAGQRRLLAYKYLRDNVDKNKYSKIEAIAKDNTNDSQNLYLALIENLQRVDLNTIDKAESYRTLIDNGFAKTHKEIANSLGVSTESVSKLLKISELDYNTKSIARECNYSNILVLEKLSNIKNSDILLQHILEKELSRKEALSYISANCNRLQLAETKLKQKKEGFKGNWGKVEITSRRTIININPNELNEEGSELLNRLIKLLEKTKEIK